MLSGMPKVNEDSTVVASTTTAGSVRTSGATMRCTEWPSTTSPPGHGRVQSQPEKLAEAMATGLVNASDTFGQFIWMTLP
ncbi:hypothetical protein MKX07_008905 [Trichoderma sp. CBMAI-0711]|nr:hypothetical protein MKX07_008905 [Trichoderma sp. CBMAI-0711]